jgi:hypothetical protein
MIFIRADRESGLTANLPSGLAVTVLLVRLQSQELRGMVQNLWLRFPNPLKNVFFSHRFRNSVKNVGTTESNLTA